MRIIEGDLTHPDVQQLLALHMNGMTTHSPAGSVYALDLSGLRKEITAPSEAV